MNTKLNPALLPTAACILHHHRRYACMWANHQGTEFITYYSSALHTTSLTLSSSSTPYGLMLDKVLHCNESLIAQQVDRLQDNACGAVHTNKTLLEGLFCLHWEDTTGCNKGHYSNTIFYNTSKCIVLLD